MTVLRASHPKTENMQKGEVNIAESGFNLVEMAIVLVIVGVLLGGLLTPLSTQFENSRRTGAQASLTDIHDALLGFAAANGRLPCPATAASNGLAAPNNATTACTSNHGFVPIRTLGLNGSVDGNTLMLDPWLRPIRYSVTNANGGAYTNDITLTLVPDFQICEQAACADVLADTVVAVLVVQGEDNSGSADQLENSDGDAVFVTTEISEAAGAEFDDQLRWLSPATLNYYLVKAGQIN